MFNPSRILGCVFRIWACSCVLNSVTWRRFLFRGQLSGCLTLLAVFRMGFVMHSRHYKLSSTSWCQLGAFTPAASQPSPNGKKANTTRIIGFMIFLECNSSRYDSEQVSSHSWRSFSIFIFPWLSFIMVCYTQWRPRSVALASAVLQPVWKPSSPGKLTSALWKNNRSWEYKNIRTASFIHALATLCATALSIKTVNFLQS